MIIALRNGFDAVSEQEMLEINGAVSIRERNDSRASHGRIQPSVIMGCLAAAVAGADLDEKLHKGYSVAVRMV
jgi:hypothetical protein